MTRSYKPAWWLRNGHLQTLWSYFIRQVPPLETEVEVLELADGDFLHLHWTKRQQGPIVLLLHGLEGSIDSPYARSLLHEADRHGWRGVLLHFRNCGGVTNRLSRTYHAGETQDLQTVVKHIRQKFPTTPLAIVGYSLGGNVLLKWLGENQAPRPIQAAVAISVPFNLDLCAQSINQGVAKLYQEYLLTNLRSSTQRKFSQMPAPQNVSLHDLSLYKSLRDFDHNITAPLHGFDSAEEYYRSSSSRQFLQHIRTPTLILQAQDDPFMSHLVIPYREELSLCVELEVVQHGGHVGFVSGKMPWRAKYWLDLRIPNFLRDHGLPVWGGHAEAAKPTKPKAMNEHKPPRKHKGEMRLGK